MTFFWRQIAQCVQIAIQQINRFLASPTYLCLWYHQINRKMKHTYDIFWRQIAWKGQIAIQQNQHVSGDTPVHLPLILSDQQENDAHIWKNFEDKLLETDNLQFNKINRFLPTPPYICLWYYQINRKMTDTYEKKSKTNCLKWTNCNSTKSTFFADTPSFTSHCKPYRLRFDSTNNIWFFFGSAREIEGKLMLLLISTNQHNFCHQRYNRIISEFNI